MPKKAFVSGCFDMLHSGHVAFFEEASHYGDLYVAIGSDRNVFELKQRPTLNSENERMYMIQSLAFVKQVFVAKGSGILDFVQELKDIQPDFFVVNQDGATPAKQKLCQDLGIEYVVLKREPHSGLAVRSTTALRSASRIPDYIDLAGGWLDSPQVSRLSSGAALILSIQPWPEWSSPTRSAAVELWDARLPADKPEKLAKILFGTSNLPGSPSITGSKAALGICYPGLTRASFAGGYWPEQITNLQEEDSLRFIEETLQLLPLETQEDDIPGQPEMAAVQALARASEACWQAILARHARALGKSLTDSYEACPTQRQPDKTSLSRLAACREQSLGWTICSLGKTTGLLLASEKPLPSALRLNIRRASD